MTCTFLKDTLPLDLNDVSFFFRLLMYIDMFHPHWCWPVWSASIQGTSKRLPTYLWKQQKQPPKIWTKNTVILARIASYSSIFTTLDLYLRNVAVAEATAYLLGGRDTQFHLWSSAFRGKPSSTMKSPHDQTQIYLHPPKVHKWMVMGATKQPLGGWYISPTSVALNYPVL